MSNCQLISSFSQLGRILLSFAVLAIVTTTSGTVGTRLTAILEVALLTLAHTEESLLELADSFLQVKAKRVLEDIHQVLLEIVDRLGVRLAAGS